MASSENALDGTTAAPTSPSISSCHASQGSSSPRHDASLSDCDPDPDDAAQKEQGRQSAVVNDCTVKRAVLDAQTAGIPKEKVMQWVVDCSRNFYVVDDKSFERAWAELRSKWEKSSSKKRKREALKQGRGAEERGVQDSQQTLRRPLHRTEKARANACRKAALGESKAGEVTFEQALAVQLVLSFEDCSVIAKAFAELLAPGSGSGRGTECPRGSELQQTPLKRLALLLHPDKSRHPRAKEAFQKLAPYLRAAACSQDAAAE
mmetsp:Transcript_65209/g.155727  ORF Transcript_65209/g.155727 Transcript_65209/m.155727 type:complete len:263 (-) Transcript_65209:36-824(-)